MEIFPCNIPVKKPGHATLALEDAWEEMQKRVLRRMNRLSHFASVYNIPEEVVAAAALKAFTDAEGNLIKDVNGELLLDTIAANDMANVLQALAKVVRPHKYVDFPNAVAVVNCEFITTKEWELIRAMGFGGSDSAICMGIHKYESSSDRILYHSKTDVSHSTTDDDKAFIFAYGHIKEPLVISEFCKRTGAKQLHCPFLYRHKTYPWMTANIDAIVQMADGSLAVFEAKTTNSNNWSEWQVGVPQQYAKQPVQYMAVLDDPRIKKAFIGCIVSNSRSDWFCHAIPRDPVQESILIEKEKEYWTQYIEPGILPDFMGNTAQDLFAFFYEKRASAPAGAVPEREELGDEARALIEEYNKINEKLTPLQKKCDTMKARTEQIAFEVYQTLKNASQGYAELSEKEEFVCGVTNTLRTSIDAEALRLAYPDAYAATATQKSTVSKPWIRVKKKPKPKK